VATAVTDFQQTEGPGGEGLDSRIQELTSIIAHRMTFLRRTALRHVGNMADAEDALQDAFLSACKHVNQFKGEAQLSTWLTAIVINSARMQVRRRPRLPHISLTQQDSEREQAAFAEWLPDHRPGPEDLCRSWEIAERIDRLSKRLSPKLSQTFQLREVDGLTIRETGKILGVRDGTVKARTARARATLRRLMRENHGGECNAA
jgi:RNA polymerase sigma-70 factor, ECF subfamily